jgi:proteasome lid subunit RPN8/RPN11
MGKLVDQSLVTIKPTAYYKMLLHVLRFGSKFLDPNQFKEVMGMLIGHLKGDGPIKDVIVEDIVPVSHGGSIEVKFSEEQLGAFGDIDQQIFDKNIDKNWFTVGWYHSHPGLNTFFSSTDKYNQLFWQDRNPSGIGIVFDHTYLERSGDLGFRAYRLDDPSKSLNSDYHEVKSIVEPPEDPTFYFNLIDLINKIHKKEPPILELNETTQLFSEVLIPEEKEFAIKKPEINFLELLNSFKEGMNSFLEMTLQPLIELINSWSQEITNKVFYNTSQMRSDLLELRNSLRQSVINIEKNYNYSLQEKLKQLDLYIDDRLDIIEGERENIENITSNFSDIFNKKLIDKFNQTLKVYIDQIRSNLEQNITRLSEIEKENKNVILSLTKNNATINEISNILEPTATRITAALKSGHSIILENYKKKLKNIESIFMNLDKGSKNVLADLKAAILILEGSKDPILAKMEKLENEKQNLHNTIRQLKNENKELLQKIVELNKGD